MADTQETIADIVAEKRRRADEIERDCAEKMKRGEMVSDCYARELVADIRREADRLEAAMKRELSKICPKTGGDFGQLNDAAKLREALEFCVKGMCGFCRMDAEARGMTTECVHGCEALLMAKAALSAPPRNCDRPECATLEMATKTWILEELGPHCNNSKATMADIRTFDVWIYAPATEQKGEFDEQK